MSEGDSDANAGRAWLLARTGDGQERTIVETLALTLWDPNGLRVALERAKPLLATAAPDVIHLHSGPTDTLRNGAAIAGEALRLCPGARLWIAVGADGTVDEYAEGRVSAQQVIDPLARASALAESLGAEVFVLDPEGEWKRAKARDANGLARDVALTCAERAPSVVQAITTYDHPSYHADFPWRGFCGAGAPASLFLPQVYAGAVVAGSQVVHPHRRALPRRAAASLASIRAAVRAGMLRADEGGEDDRSSRDLDVAPYLQGHSVHEHASSQMLIESPIVSVWAAMARLDAAGRAAYERAVRVRREYYARAGVVRAIQAELGLIVDGDLGPKTAAAIDTRFR